MKHQQGLAASRKSQGQQLTKPKSEMERVGLQPFLNEWTACDHFPGWAEGIHIKYMAPSFAQAMRSQRTTESHSDYISLWPVSAITPYNP